MMILFLSFVTILVPLVFPKIHLCIPKRNIFLLNFIFSESRFQIIPLSWNMLVQKIKLFISLLSLYLKCNLRVSGICWRIALCNYFSLSLYLGWKVSMVLLSALLSDFWLIYYTFLSLVTSCIDSCFY